MHCCYETWPLVQDVDWWFGKWFLDDSLLLICLFYLFLYDSFICSFSIYLFVFSLSRLLITAVPNGQILPHEKKWISTTFCYQNEVVCLFMWSFLVFLFFHLIVSLFVFAFLEFEARFFLIGDDIIVNFRSRLTVWITYAFGFQEFLRDVFHSCLFSLPEDCCDERDLPLCKSKVKMQCSTLQQYWRLRRLKWSCVSRWFLSHKIALAVIGH